MKGISLLKKYPHSATAINEWMTKQLLESVKTEDVPEEFKEYLIKKGVKNEQIAKFIDANPRCLFELLDENGIFIQILHDNDTFAYKIEMDLNEGWETRKLAEKNGAIEGLKQLELKLKKKLE